MYGNESNGSNTNGTASASISQGGEAPFRNQNLITWLESGMAGIQQTELIP